LEKGQVLYFGDSFMENGNDVVVEERWFEVVKVNSPEDTFRVLKEILQI
jgi:hypothetical protein